MPMQTGVGFSTILHFVGGGLIGKFLYEYIKFSDELVKLRALVKEFEKSKNKSKGYSNYSDAVAAAAQSLTKMQGKMTFLVIPVATLGALGGGYMWWKGFSFSDLMCVTKRNMANAVSNLTKYLEHVTEALAATKRHLKQRIENLNDETLKQNEHIAGVQKSLSDIDFNLRQLQNIVSGLDGKISSLECKQELANAGLLYLCNFADGKKEKMPEALKMISWPPAGLDNSEAKYN